MARPAGLSRFIHDGPCRGWPHRESCAQTARHVFELIWPQAGVECHAAEAGLRIDLGMGGLRHAVHVPWGLLEFDRGLTLVRAVYRAGLPLRLQSATAGLSLSL